MTLDVLLGRGRQNRRPARPGRNAAGAFGVSRHVPAIRFRRGERSIMKVRNSLRSLKSKPGSVVTRRRGRMVVINRKNPRWNGRQG
jgi:large subunit ribosomal protein L36